MQLHDQSNTVTFSCHVSLSRRCVTTNLTQTVESIKFLIPDSDQKWYFFPDCKASLQVVLFPGVLNKHREDRYVEEKDWLVD